MFANLTADILQLLREEITKVVKRGTLLVLSGILDTKLDEVKAAYCDGFEVLSTQEKGEWRALLLQVK